MFLRIGPFDGFIHISQLGDDFYAQSGDALVGRKTGETFRKGDVIRARIISIGKPQRTFPEKVRNSVLEGGQAFMKIILTCRQPGLGKVKVLKENETEGVQKV